MTEETVKRLQAEAIERNGGKCAYCESNDGVAAYELAPTDLPGLTEDDYRTNCVPLCIACYEAQEDSYREHIQKLLGSIKEGE